MHARWKPNLVTLWFVAVSLAVWPLYRVHVALHERMSKIDVEHALRFVPSGKLLSVVTIGYDNLAADFLWLRGISLFGEQYHVSRDVRWYDWLYQLVDLATDLDPLDVSFHKYGGLMLRVGGARVDQSNLIFRKGMEHIPDEYFLPFGIAMNYLEFKHDIRKAAEYMRIAAMRPNAPFYLGNLAATLMDRTQQNQAALLFLEEQLKLLEPGSLRYRTVEVKIMEVKHDDGAGRLQRALAEYLSLYHRPPDSLKDLVGTTFFGDWPEDPYGGDYVLERRTGIIRSSNYHTARMRIRRELGLGGAPSEEEIGPALPKI